MKSINLLYMSLTNNLEKNGKTEIGRYLLKSMGSLLLYNGKTWVFFQFRGKHSFSEG